MADINQFSNEEIRVQLQRFGYHVGPVTQYSRNVYIKRLQQLLSGNKDKYTKSDVTTRLSTLSSEEDTDETGTASSNRSGRKKRSSSHYPSSNVSYRNSRAASDIKDPYIVNAFRVPVIRSARKSVLERGSREARERAGFRRRYADYPSGLESSESDEADAQSGIQSRKKKILSDRKNIYQSSIAESRRKLLPSGSSTSSLLSSIRSAINPLGSLMTAFARRSRVADNCIENNGFIPQSRFGSLERQGNRTLDSFLTTEERNWFSRNCQVVPKTLVLIVMLFFLGLAVSYAALGRVKSFRSHTGNHYPICAKEPTNSLRNCVPKVKLQATINLIKIVTPLIEQKSEEYSCQLLYGEVVPEQILLTNSSLSAFLTGRKYPHSQHDIKNMEVLILSNPHWGYTLNRTNGGEVLYAYPSRASIKCYLIYHLNWFVNRLVEAALCVMVIYIIFKLLSAYKAHADAHKRNVRGMVGRITKFLRAEFDNIPDEPAFVVIDYVRDQLIPAQDYKRMALVWTSAVNFIRHNDSRIKEEQCVVNGELKSVWRWLPESGNVSSEQSYDSSNLSPGRRSILSDENFPGDGDVSHQKLSRSNSHRSSKIWQGQAFETMAGSPNSVPCSPTPCLKIRHMFDPDAEHGEDWPTFIRDAILEKCEGVSILHLFVDKTSREGCVYVKCRTPEDAGRAYCALHGWWFGNSHLVTVKYLRIERYHERFPAAVNATTVLKPSNNQRLSLGD